MGIILRRKCWRMIAFLNKHVDILYEVLLRVVLLLVFWYLEYCSPFQRVIKLEELWLYQNPIKQSDTVPTPILMVVCMGIPSTFIITLFFSTRHVGDLRQGFLGLSLTACINGVVTNLIKLSVGRPRPDFFYRCFPNGQVTSDLLCVGDFATVEEGRKSFPSGHSAWSFACFGFLSLYLIGKLQCLRPEGRGQGWRLTLSLTPLMVATLVALSRLQDHKHHWDDVLAGSLIGWCIACVCYLHHYHPPWHPHGYLPYPSHHNTTQAGLVRSGGGGGGKLVEDFGGTVFKHSTSMLSLPTSHYSAVSLNPRTI